MSKKLRKPRISQDSWNRILTILCLGFVTITSYFTYVHNFQEPRSFYWDENYHVASAQKYLNGIFFMEQHPPLGKLLIALGEKIIDASDNDTQFINTNYAKGNFSDGFSITGYRLIPVLLAWLVAPLIFLCFLLISRAPLLSALLSFFYIFDNALIVHLRGAMLEGPLIFFFILTILCFLCLIQKPPRKTAKSPRLVISLLMGIAFACAFLTKLTGLILLLLLPALALKLYPNWKKMLVTLGCVAGGFILTFILVWQTHFALGQKINPELEKEGRYKASEEVVAIVKSGKQLSPLTFPLLLRDSIKFVTSYNKGVPVLDLCKPDENGSPFFLWPIGARSINYRWTKTGEDIYRYLYLQANPAIWWSAFIGVLAAVSLMILPLIHPLKKKPGNRFLILTFLALYISYMATISQLDRVMYLYHYFPPLILSFLILSLIIVEARTIGKWKLNNDGRCLFMIGLALVVFLSFQFYRPLTYYEPIANKALERRRLIDIWDLKCVNCERPHTMVKPRSSKPGRKNQSSSSSTSSTSKSGL